ncbi:MAG: response regulator, partial [Myroides sp.]|nr:response regulator [Myroides sp.]
VLDFKIDNYLDTDFYSDSYRIQQILTNVISNAIKFTHKGHVTIDASFVNNHAKIKVTDTGIGINSKDHDALFKEFVQVHDTNEGNYGGSGLGLNITKRLITLLNGSIWYESELNKGTVFFINIPLKIYSEANHVQKTEDYEYDNAKKLQNKKILVIDDDLLQLKLIEEIFGNKVKKLTTLDNGKFVKEILQQEQYQLIITDMQMPLYSGLKVIEDIRSLENYRHTPVIALTGKIDFDEQEYKSLGFDLYMQKPLNINNLYNTIYKLLRIKHKVQQTSTIQPLPIQLQHDTFDLTDIFNLLDNDKEAIEPILTTFFNSYKIDIEHLKTAYENSDKENLKHTAHKMLPMFRQLHINEIVDKLAKIEREIDSLSTEQLLIEIQFIDERTPIIFQEIKKLFD